MRVEVSTVREYARNQWTGLLGRLAPTLERALARPGRHVPCPVHGGHDGFRVFRDVNQTGGGICNTCGSFSDGFALLMWANDWSFRQALEAVAQDLRLDAGGAWSAPKPRLQPNPVPCRDQAAAEESLRGVWEETLDPTDRKAAPLRRYLRRRGIASTAGFRRGPVPSGPGVLRGWRAKGHLPGDDRTGVGCPGTAGVPSPDLPDSGRPQGPGGECEEGDDPLRGDPGRGYPAFPGRSRDGHHRGHRNGAGGAATDRDARLGGGVGGTAGVLGTAGRSPAGGDLGGFGPLRNRAGRSEGAA